MDQDQNGWNNWNQKDQGQWDRWDSSASNSSYYNQPTHRPYNQGFAIASLVLGLLSVTLGCCGLSIPLGAIGILLGLLCYRKVKRMENNSRMGLTLSVIGFTAGIIFGVVSIIRLPAMLQDPVYAEQYNRIFQMMFGMDFNEFIRQYYGSF